MYFGIRDYLHQTINCFDQIPQERKAILATLAGYIRHRYEIDQRIQIIYICTHNSRRSHFGQVAATLASEFYAIDQVFTYSGGTEVSALNPNAKNAFIRIGLKIFSDGSSINPIYHIYHGVDKYSTCFSKVYDAPDNPTQNFVAVMTCSDADEKCPNIPRADLRIATTYEDPKTSDESEFQDQTYDARLLQIITETMYAFSLV